MVAEKFRVYVGRVRIRCPTCGKQDLVEDDHHGASGLGIPGPGVPGGRWRPFCSRRCKMIDLGNWLDEVYTFSRPLGVHDVADEPTPNQPAANDVVRRHRSSEG